MNEHPSASLTAIEAIVRRWAAAPDPDRLELTLLPEIERAIEPPLRPPLIAFDGRENFARGWPGWAIVVSIWGAADDPDGEPLLALIADPARSDYFTAIRGGGAWLNGSPLRVSTIARVEDALLAGSFPADRWTNRDNNSEEWNSFLVRAQSLRCSGSAALDLASVAAGRADGGWMQTVGREIAAAGRLLVQEAGGRVSNYRGVLDGVAAGEKIVASNGLIHERMLTIVMMGELAPRPGKR